MNSKYRMTFEGRNRITSPYGNRQLNGSWGWHNGLDIVGDDDKQVRAVIGGVVLQSRMVPKGNDPTWEWGNYVSVKDEDGNVWYYCHMASRAVQKGQIVAQGDVLGIMGNTGYSFGAHTHLEQRNGAGKVQPVPATLGILNACQTIDYHTPAPAPVTMPQEPGDLDEALDQIAEDVIRGIYGNGSIRKQKLEALGWDYYQVQERVEELLRHYDEGKTEDIKDVAREVIRGEWGNGEERSERLTGSGYDYREVQDMVNAILRGEVR